MFKSLINIPRYLNLGDVGILELVFAFTLMLSGFGLAGLPLSVLMWPILMVIVIVKKGTFSMKIFKPLTIFVIYWAFHDLILMTIADVNHGRFLAQCIYFLAVPMIYPALNIDKLKGSLNWVAIIAIAGLLYQWGIISSGGSVRPLEIPGLTMGEVRMNLFTIRPSSFFMEPQAYVSFIICPLAFAMLDKKYIWAIVMIVSVFLTTSTTGLVLSFIILLTSLIGKGVKKSSWLIIILIIFGSYYILINYDAFEFGVQKFERTAEAGTDVRLAQGPYIVGTMHPEEFIFGAPYGSPYDYCISGRATDVQYLGESVFVSTFWHMILRYGIVGLVLYLLIYFRIFKMSRETWPLAICLCATMFSDPDMFSNSYCFRLIVLLVIAENGVRKTITSKVAQ